MAKLNETFVNNAKKYIGEGPARFRKWFYGYDKKGIPWCAIFVSYVAEITGISKKTVEKCTGAGDIPRLGVKANGGKWYEGHNTRPQVGDIILFTENGLGHYPGKDAYYSSHVGIVSRVGSNCVYSIEGNTGNNDDDKSKVMEHEHTLYSGFINGYYRPNWDGKSGSAEENKTSDKITEKIPDAIYRVRAGGKWYPAVKNLEDYAGVIGKSITDVAIKFTEGSCKYQVHIKGGGWLPWVTGYNINDGNNGYAGDNKIIDAIRIVYNGKYKAQYRVSPVKSNYYSFQTNTETTKGQDGYAGSYGRSIDRLQIKLVK